MGCQGFIELPEGAEANPGASAGSAGSGSGAAAGGSAGTSADGCTVGQAACNGTCVDTSTDQSHCGACGVACGAGTFCENGSCAVLCAANQLECAGACATVQSDLGNCGACGVACAAGQYCSAGVCGDTCPYQVCDGASGLECADVQTNPDHCGACGAACPQGQSCVGGFCELQCPDGRAACGGACVQTQSDALNCGTCGNACPSGTPCIAGACGCPSGQALCNGVCVDVQADALNCGACAKACATGQLCEAGQCTTGCSVGSTQCGGGCVDPQTSNAHCGTCNNACTSGRSCVGGQCTCPEGQQFCDGACVDTIANENHCGGCGVECTAGRSCESSACDCPGEQVFCTNACVDTETSNEHCGECGDACSGGQSCDAGECVCPDGLTFCGGNCVDTEATDAHCGECDAPCALGKACVSGACTGGGGTGEDGCSGLAKNISVTQVAVYQSVKIPVMDGGAEIAPASRITDVVAGRETMFRVFVTPGTGFTAREVSARLIVVNGGTPTSYYQKKTISGTSAEADQATTFQLYVPKDDIQTETTFYVELVDCTTTTGSAASPRYPAGDAEAALGARETGPLKVTIIPLRANSRVPSTSADALTFYSNYLRAMYPVDDVQMTVGDEVNIAYPVDWNAALDQVRAKRQADQVAADIYYYGLLAPTTTFNEFCQGGCTAGIGFVGSANQASARASLGIGWADNASATTMAHELGHNHGRNHAPCGNVAGADQNYPHSNAQIGVWGYDYRTKTLLNPNNNTDIMGYCSNKWISDYTYDALVTRVAAVNGNNNVLVFPEAFGTFRVLLLDSRGPRWGIPITEPSVPSGEPELAEILDAGGGVVATVDVYRTEVPDIGAASLQVPEPLPDWHAVRVAGWPAIAFAAPISIPVP